MFAQFYTRTLQSYPYHPSDRPGPLVLTEFWMIPVNGRGYQSSARLSQAQGNFVFEEAKKKTEASRRETFLW